MSRKVLRRIVAFALAFIIYQESCLAITASQIGQVVFRGASGALATWQAEGSFRANPVGIGAAVAVGAVIAAYELSDMSGSKIRLGSGVDAPVETPAGWSSPETPPSQHPFYYYYVADGVSGSFGTAAALCSSIGSYQTYSCGNPAGNGTCMGSNGCMNSSTIRAVQYCDSGYHSDQAKCVLDTPSAAKWPSDGIPTYRQRSDRTYERHPRDPDTDSSTVVSGNTATRSGTDGYGNKVKETITILPDGGSDYQRKSETVDQNGLPKTVVDTVHTDNTGTVKSATTANLENTSLDNSDSQTGNGSSAASDVAASISNLQSSVISSSSQIAAAVNAADSDITSAVNASQQVLSQTITGAKSDIVQSVAATTNAVTSLGTELANVKASVDAVSNNLTGVSKDSSVIALGSKIEVLGSKLDTVSAKDQQIIDVATGIKTANETMSQLLRDLPQSMSPIIQPPMNEIKTAVQQSSQDVVNAVANQTTELNTSLRGVAQDSTLKSVDTHMADLVGKQDSLITGLSNVDSSVKSVNASANAVKATIEDASQSINSSIDSARGSIVGSFDSGISQLQSSISNIKFDKQGLAQDSTIQNLITGVQSVSSNVQGVTNKVDAGSRDIIAGLQVVSNGVNVGSRDVVGALDGVIGAVQGVQEGVSALDNTVAQVIDAVQALPNQITSVLLPPLTDIKDTITQQTQGIKDKLSEADGESLPVDDLGDNPADIVLPNDKIPEPDKQSLAAATERFESSVGNFFGSVDNYTDRTGIKNYFQGYFPSSGGSGGSCPPPIVVETPIINKEVEIPIDCRIIIAIGDFMVAFATAVAFSIARGGR